MASTSIKLDDEMKGRIRSLAQARQRTSESIVQEAVSQYVEREEQRDALRRDTLTAWDEAQTSGLHVTHAEVDRWLESWGTEDERPNPECRGLM
jgi:predicted transcriptional regulator